METEFPSFEETYAQGILEDDERFRNLRARLSVPLNTKRDPISGWVDSGGVTIESLGVGKARVNMKMEVMEKILDYYEKEIDKHTSRMEELYALLDNR